MAFNLLSFIFIFHLFLPFFPIIYEIENPKSTLEKAKSNWWFARCGVGWLSVDWSCCQDEAILFELLARVILLG